MEPINLDHLNMDDGRYIHVLRDDLLPGGSKQRAVIPLLKELKNQGVTKVTYASPFAGFAQVALAQGCKTVGLTCLIFVEFDPTQEGRNLHPYSRLAQSFGAEVIMVEDLQEAEAQTLKALKESFEKIPLGFQCETFQKHFQLAIEVALKEIRLRLGTVPRRIWLPVGSATLASAFLEVIDKDIELLCVDVHVLPMQDPRLTKLRDYSQVKLFSSAQKFAEQSDIRPPLPSNVHYDAKLWKFISREGRDGDLWWNVAK